MAKLAVCLNSPLSGISLKVKCLFVNYTVSGVTALKVNSFLIGESFYLAGLIYGKLILNFDSGLTDSSA